MAVSVWRHRILASDNQLCHLRVPTSDRGLLRAKFLKKGLSLFFSPVFHEGHEPFGLLAL